MKSLHLSRRALLVPAALALAASLHAQSNATPPALGLLRLKGTARPNETAPLAAAKFAVDELSATGVVGASKSKKDNADYLALDAGKAWSRSLRGSLALAIVNDPAARRAPANSCHAPCCPPPPSPSLRSVEYPR